MTAPTPAFFQERASNGPLLRALTVHRPWSDLIATGHMPVANRSWTTTYRGLLLVHAGTGWSHDATFIARDLGHPVPYRESSSLGHVAVVHLHDVHVAGKACGDQCRDYGMPARFHWMLRLVLPLAVPIPERSHQRLWTPSLATQGRVRTQLERSSWSAG